MSEVAWARGLRPVPPLFRFARRRRFSTTSAPQPSWSDVTPENQFRRLSECVTPLASLDYPQQLKMKQTYSRQILKTLYSNRRVPRYPTTLHPILPSPMTEGYRNKDDFSVNTGLDGDPKTVGFYLGSPRPDNVLCVPPTRLPNIKPLHSRLSQVYQELMRASPLRACVLLHEGGFWRNLVVRSNRKGESMVCAVVFPPSPDLQQSAADNLHHFSDLMAAQGVSSVYYQSCGHVKCSSSVAPYQLLYGKKHLVEELGGFKFQISPDSFFQINVEAAELLYSRTLDLARLSPTTTLLDLCCGTGAVSVLGSRRVRGCVGIEAVDQAVQDARTNARINSLTNCHFVSGTVEKTLSGALKELDCAPDIVGVLNPGRSGVSRSVVKALRKCSRLRNLIYISCKADHRFAQTNFMDLVDPELDRGSPPFVLTQVQPVDMFPHTVHTELVMVFDR